MVIYGFEMRKTKKDCLGTNERKGRRVIFNFSILILQGKNLTL